MNKFNLMGIGSGSGLEVFADAADRGVSVAAVEEGPFGGTCLNRGCIPSKMLIHFADISVDWQQIIRRVSEEVDGDARAVEEGNRQSPNVTVFKGTGKFVAEKTLEVNGGRISADIIVIAAGTRPSVPDIPGLEDVPYITSDEALPLPEQPRRLAIIGGGYIAAEMAHFYGCMGTEVTIVHRGPLLLRTEDEDVARRFTEVYQRKFNLLLNAAVTRVRAQGAGISLEVPAQGDTTELLADILLVPIGRIANSDLLDVGRTGVEVDDRGFIKTDEYLGTNVPGVWALWDFVGKYLLKHSAKLDAAYASNNINEALDVLKSLDLEQYLDEVLTREDVEKAKPGPEIYLLAAQKLGVQPQDCLVLEDSPNGVRAGVAAGMNVIEVATPFTITGLHKSQVLEHAWVVHDPEKLLDVVRDRIAEHNRSPH